MIKLFTCFLIVISTSCSFDDLINGTNIYEATPLYPSLSLFHHEDYIECDNQVDKFLSKSTRGVNIVINQYVDLDDKSVTKYCYKSKNNNCNLMTNERIYFLEKQLTRCISTLVKNAKASKVYFNMTGEMGNTVFLNAKSYQELAANIKLENPHLKVGIGLNFNRINGDAKPNKIQRKDLQLLIDELDFVGFSNYKAVTARKNEIQFQDAVWDFVKELKSFDVIFPKTKELHFSEIGIGGGASKYDGHTVAKSFNEALGAPFSGIHSSYQKDKDPWANSEVKRARYFYYYTLAKYLSQKKRYNLTRAYLWNVGSWDFMNIYPGSWGYEDKELADYLIDYNKSIYLE